jgi:hypothetical protein
VHNFMLTICCSLGMKNDDGIEKHYRLNTLHVRGTENMSTRDIFNYFKDYGPASMEWINDYSCMLLLHKYDDNYNNSSLPRFG